jgi:hypothetical protein
MQVHLDDVFACLTDWPLREAHFLTLDLVTSLFLRFGTVVGAVGA